MWNKLLHGKLFPCASRHIQLDLGVWLLTRPLVLIVVGLCVCFWSWYFYWVWNHLLNSFLLLYCVCVCACGSVCPYIYVCASVVILSSPPLTVFPLPQSSAMCPVGDSRTQSLTMSFKGFLSLPYIEFTLPFLWFGSLANGFQLPLIWVKACFASVTPQARCIRQGWRHSHERLDLQLTRMTSVLPWDIPRSSSWQSLPPQQSH